MDTRDGFRWVQQIEPCFVMGWRLYNLRVGDFFGCFQLEVLGVQLSKRESKDCVGINLSTHLNTLLGFGKITPFLKYPISERNIAPWKIFFYWEGFLLGAMKCTRR